MKDIIAPIPAKELRAFYQEVGKTIADWLASLECPNCKDKSDVDWVLRSFSDGKPQLVCRHCGKRYLIKGLNFKRTYIIENPFTMVVHTHAPLPDKSTEEIRKHFDKVYEEYKKPKKSQMHPNGGIR